MKKTIFLVMILGSQLVAQINEGQYYCDEIYESLSENQEVIYAEKVEGNFSIYVDPYGIRIKKNDNIGYYYPWVYIGYFVDYQTYLLDNGDKIVLAPEINGLYHFYDRQDNEKEYKKIIEYHNVKEKK